MLLRALLLVALSITGCSRQAPVVDTKDASTSSCPEAACASDEICIEGACVPTSGACSSDNDCINDNRCYCAAPSNCFCVPWGSGSSSSDPSCGRSGIFPISEFQMSEKCHWLPPNHELLVTVPLVVDLDLDGLPEVIVSTVSADLNAPLDSTLVALRGTDCSELWTRTFSRDGAATPAAADLDGDGLPELVMTMANDDMTPPTLAVLNNQGIVIAQSDAIDLSTQSVTTANVDGVGPPEIGLGGAVYRFDPVNRTLKRLFDNPAGAPFLGYGSSVFADLDGDGVVELIAGTRVFDGITGLDKTPSGLREYAAGAFVGVADFNGDGAPDLAIVQSAQKTATLSIFDFTNDAILFGPYEIYNTFWDAHGIGGPPTIADFDGDLVPDVAIAGSEEFDVFALKCAQMPRPADCSCRLGGALWCSSAHDDSAICGSAAFDFNGDGVAESVYRDECWLRVFDGRTGATLFARGMTSSTAIEYPVVADVDGDDHADIVVTSDDFGRGMGCDVRPDPTTGATWQLSEGLFIFSDPKGRWASTRPLWTSHPYHITEINDDYSVPVHEPSSWTRHNSYRENSSGPKGNRLPDFTAAPSPSVDNGPSDCAVVFHLHALLCNRGASVAGAGVPGAFYQSDPRVAPSQPICVTKTTSELLPGQCEDLSCDWQSPPTGAQDLWFRANDDGLKHSPLDECHSGNDVVFLGQVTCRQIG